MLLMLIIIGMPVFLRNFCFLFMFLTLFCWLRSHDLNYLLSVFLRYYLLALLANLLRYLHSSLNQPVKRLADSLA